MSDQPLEGEVLVEVDKLEIVGKLVKVVAGYGAGVIVSQVISANVEPKNVIQKVGITLGAMALCGLAAHHAGNYAKEYTDELIETCRGVAEKVTELQAEIKKIKEANA